MDIRVPIPVSDTDAMYLREAWAEAEDDKTGNIYELTRTDNLILLNVKRPDGTSRQMKMFIKDLLIQWAVVLDAEEVTA